MTHRVDSGRDTTSPLIKFDRARSIGDSNQAVLLNSEQTKDLQNTLKKRRIEIYFRNRYISIDNNANMKKKITKFIGKQQNATKFTSQQPAGRGLSTVPSSVELLNQQRSALIHNESKKQILGDLKHLNSQILNNEPSKQQSSVINQMTLIEDGYDSNFKTIISSGRPAMTSTLRTLKRVV